MQPINTTIPAPSGSTPDTTIKAIKPCKYSPHGWDMVKIKPGEVALVPAHIAKIFIEEGRAELAPAEEEEVKDVKPAKSASTTRR